MEAKLVVVGGKANMGEVKLRLPMTIGRGHKADLMISHPTVSREHCRLSEKNGELLVHDNGSSNGTFVDGEKITKPTVVHPGQILAIGPLTFRAEYEGPTARVGKKPSGELAETQAIDKDELDLDFLLTDDEAPAAPAPKAKADKKTIEAKAPTAPAGKPSKDVAPAAKEKPKSAAPEKAPPAKSPAIGPPAGVSDTSDIDVDFLLDDLKEEQSQAPASRDTAEVDFSDLDFGEPEAKAEPAKKAPEAAPPKKADEPKQPEAFEQTVDFSSAGDLAEDFPGLIDDDTLPTEKNNAGADDFDFLSDLDDSPAAAPKFDIPAPEAKQAEPKIPEAKQPEIAPAEEAAPPLVDDDLDLDAFLGGLETTQPEEPARTEEPVAKVEPETAETAPLDEAAKSEPSPAAADATLDDFLADLDLDAGPKTEAAKEPEFGELEASSEEAVAPTSDAEATAEIRTSEEAAKEPEFDFSAFAETQELETIDAPPPAEAAEQTPAVGEVKEEPAAAGDEIAFDFLDEPQPEAVAPPTVEVPPEAKQPEAEVDFDFLAADVGSDEKGVAEAPAAEQEFEATLNFDAVDAAAPVDELPKFDLEEPSQPQAEAAPAEAATAADDFDFLADLGVEAEAKPEAEKSEAAAPSEAEPFEATLNFDAVEPAPSTASDAAVESPNFDFEPAAPVAESPTVEKPATAAADEFDFLADLGAEPAVETSPPAEAFKAEAPAEKAPADAADEFDFLSDLEPAKPAESPQAELDETAMFSVDAVGQTEAPSAEAVAQEPKAEIEPSWDFDAVETPAPSAEAPAAPQAEPSSVEAETAMFTAFDAPAEPTAKPTAEAAAPDFAAFDAAATEPAQASETTSEPATPNFDVAASAAPAAKPVKPAAAKGPSFVEKLKMLFGGSKGAAKKAPAAKKAGKSGQAEPAAPSKPMYQPVVPLPTAREDAPIPLDDTPIKLDDFAAEPATERWSPAAAPNSGAPESPLGIDEFVAQDEFRIEAGPAASDLSPTGSAPTGEIVTPAKEESFDAFVAELDAVAPAASTGEPIASTPTDATSVDPLELDLLGEERQSLAGDAPQTTDAAPAAAADADFMMEFAADELDASPTEQAASDSAAETNEASAADEFFNVDLGAAPATSEEAAANAPADLFAPSESTSPEAAPPADIAAISPAAPAARRPQSIDIDLRTTSSLRPLARLNVQRPRIDTPEMQPDEPAGRSFAPRAKQTPPPAAPPQTPIDVGASLTDDVPNDAAFAWDAPASDVPPGDMSMGDAPAADAPAAELGDADFDFFTKEQEAEAALDATAATPAEADATPSSEPAAEFDFLSDASVEASTPEPQAEAGDDEFILMLDDVDAAATDEPSNDASAAATTEAPAGDASAKSAELDLDFLDLELNDAPAPDAANNLPQAAAKPDEAKPTQQPVTSKKQSSDDAELDDFLRDLGMN